MFHVKKTLWLCFAALIVAGVVNWMSGSSDVVDFLRDLRYAHLRNVSVIDKSGTAPRRVRLLPGRAWRRVYDELQRARPVRISSVNIQDHNRFYLIELCTDQDGCTQLEVVNTAKNEGILQAHSSTIYLRNDTLSLLMDSLLRK